VRKESERTIGGEERLTVPAIAGTVLSYRIHPNPIELKPTNKSVPETRQDISQEIQNHDEP
jgi:hypothetical protein